MANAAMGLIKAVGGVDRKVDESLSARIRPFGYEVSGALSHSPSRPIMLQRDGFSALRCTRLRTGGGRADQRAPEEARPAGTNPSLSAAYLPPPPLGPRAVRPRTTHGTLASSICVRPIGVCAPSDRTKGDTGGLTSLSSVFVLTRTAHLSNGVHMIPGRRCCPTIGLRALSDRTNEVHVIPGHRLSDRTNGVHVIPNIGALERRG
eukprot:3813915-Rhodomonas_salina.1